MAGRAKFWAQFHKVWGLNKNGTYDKEEWIKLQAELEALEFERNEFEQKILNLPRDPDFGWG